MDFTLDSRWVAVTTLRGTTHLFPITAYGGKFYIDYILFASVELVII